MIYGSEYYAQYLDLIRNGLPPRSGPRQKVIIVGAGIAGLVAAFELLHAGHDPLILEGRGRIGGRLYTLREPFSSGLYAEAGGMRIPKSHQLTLAYIEKFDLPTLPFRMGNEQTFSYLHGRRQRTAESLRDPESLGYPI
ncbi:MAG TPA: FAD-dependent oxidoreductase, partial [Anaerolineales bacterium]|nr:FAD-dependent oxidoreductase [Anaerolineales bacterium]